MGRGQDTAPQAAPAVVAPAATLRTPAAVPDARRKNVPRYVDHGGVREKWERLSVLGKSQAASRAVARAARSAARAEGSTPASSRQTVGVEATGPNTSAWSRSAARSAIASPPSASITARSTAIRPGACPVPRGRSRHSASAKAALRPVASARSAGRREPTWRTTPRPSADTTSLGRDPVACTQKVPSCCDDRDLGQASSSQLRRHLRRPSADAQRQAEVDAVTERCQAVSGELLDPLKAVAERVDVDVQLFGAAVPGA